ncbi:hypothetical protein P9112_004545 [Eukaryota sp. TZLM1-RC]
MFSITFVCVLVFTILIGCETISPVSVEPASDLQHIFSAQSQGWLGADVACSIPIPVASQFSFWIFGDTLIGKSDGQRRVIEGMPRNSAALLNIETLQPYFLLHNDNQKPFFPPVGPNSWLWPIWLYSTSSDSINVLSYSVVDDASDPFGFKVNSTVLSTITDLARNPFEWTINSHNLEFTNCDFTLAAGVLHYQHYVYFIGVERFGGVSRNLLLRSESQKPLKSSNIDIVVLNGSLPTYIPLTSYSPSLNTPLSFAEGTSEGSLLYWKEHFFWFYNDAFSCSIDYRVAKRFEGPWSESKVLYVVPERFRKEQRFFYAPKVHLELSSENELILTYATNSFDQDELEDAELYVPRFIRSIWQ